jgi:hypothetical protein
MFEVLCEGFARANPLSRQSGTKVAAARMILISPSSSITQRHFGIKKLRSALGARARLDAGPALITLVFARPANVYFEVVVTNLLEFHTARFQDPIHLSQLCAIISSVARVELLVTKQQLLGSALLTSIFEAIKTL